MALLDTPETWFPGAVTSAMLNARVRDKLRQLQVAIPRGVISDLTGFAANCSGTGFVVITGLSVTLNLDSARTLQANFQMSLQASNTGLVPQVISRINGATSANWQDPFDTAGATGQKGASAGGFAVPVPAGTSTVDVVIRLRSGAGTVSVLDGAKLQVVDLGPS